MAVTRFARIALEILFFFGNWFLHFLNWCKRSFLLSFFFFSFNGWIYRKGGKIPFSMEFSTEWLPCTEQLGQFVVIFGCYYFFLLYFPHEISHWKSNFGSLSLESIELIFSLSKSYRQRIKKRRKSYHQSHWNLPNTGDVVFFVALSTLETMTLKCVDTAQKHNRIHHLT